MLKNVQEIMSGDVTHATVWLWDEELSNAEAAAIHARVQSDPHYREDLEGLLSVFAAMESLADKPAVEAIARDYRQLLRDRRAKRRFALGMAAGILAALGAVFAVFLPRSGDHELPMHFTRVGEQRTIDLADGSVVTLNTGGELMVNFSGAARRILLERGEAYFEVVDDRDRPFTVDLGAHAITALGTAFGVRKDPNRYRVAVTEGAVAFHEDAEGRPVPAPAIEAGWVAEFDARGAAQRMFQPESMQRYVGWRAGNLSFTREPLYQVIQELNRYTRRKILIEDPSIQELKVFVAVPIEDIDAALEGLERVLPIEITRHYDRIVITASTGDKDENKKVKR